jgi:hypothetical protein
MFAAFIFMIFITTLAAYLCVTFTLDIFLSASFVFNFAIVTDDVVVLYGIVLFDVVFELANYYLIK